MWSHAPTCTSISEKYIFRDRRMHYQFCFRTKMNFQYRYQWKFFHREHMFTNEKCICPSHPEGDLPQQYQECGVSSIFRGSVCWDGPYSVFRDRGAVRKVELDCQKLLNSESISIVQNVSLKDCDRTGVWHLFSS